ncbi:MAG: hypothetical protein NZ651_06900 [Candidatus Bipolaricaulota bacterium]|nr:hypothetical protein [Candidatus Bipolaricaulota bacterium]
MNGEVIVLTPASERHQALRGFLEAVMTIYVEQKGLGEGIGSPLPDENRARAPWEGARHLVSGQRASGAIEGDLSRWFSPPGD